MHALSSRFPTTVADGFELQRLASRWRRRIDRALKPVDLTHTEFLVLSALAAEHMATNDAVSQRAVANAAGIDESTVSRAFQRLEYRGLVDRGPTFGDARAYRIYPARRAAGLLALARPLLERASNEFFTAEATARLAAR